jgi:hypothetical protein
VDEHHKNQDPIQKPPNYGEQNNENVNHRGNEEFSAELMVEEEDELERKDSHHEPVTVYGWIGIILSVLSFFAMPLILGAAGIILGFISRNRGANTLGNIAIIAGAVSVLFSVFLWPFI